MIFVSWFVSMNRLFLTNKTMKSPFTLLLPSIQYFSLSVCLGKKTSKFFFSNFAVFPFLQWPFTDYITKTKLHNLFYWCIFYQWFPFTPLLHIKIIILNIILDLYCLHITFMHKSSFSSHNDTYEYIIINALRFIS